MDMTIWHADRNADILFPIEPYWYVPTNGGWEQSQWSKWTRWYFSDGAYSGGSRRRRSRS